MGPVILVVVLITGLLTNKGLSYYSFFAKYNFDLARIRKGEYYRLITSGFLHVDWVHFAFNMFSMYMFASYVSGIGGTIFFLGVYLASIAIGNILTYQMYNKQSNYYAVGASGGVSGIIFSSILLNPDMKLYLFFIPIGIKGYIFAILYLLYSIYGMKKNLGNIGHSAHFGGAIGGMGLTLIRYPELIFIEQKLILILLGIIGLLAYLVKMNKI